MALPVRFFSLLFGGLLLGSIPLCGQWTLSGQVVDAESGEGLSYVNIVFDHDAMLTTTSDHQGQFHIDGLTREWYDVKFIMIGFRTYHIDTITSASSPLHIELQPESYLADEVVVSASRKSQHLKLAPASVSLVTRQQLLERGTTSFDEALTGINGILATRSSNSNVQSISIRGASEVAGGGIGNRVLLLLDGRPAITPESGGALWNLVPLGAVERIEVIKGAYSSLFGSSAMGGIVNIITREPKADSRTELSMNYGFYDKPPTYVDYNHYRDFFDINATYSNIIGKWSYLFNGSMKSNDGHRQMSAFDLYNGFGKIKFSFSPNRSLEMSAMYSDIQNNTPATWLSITQPYHVAAHRLDDSQHRREWNADLHYQAFAHSNLKYATRFYYYGAFSDYVFNGDPENDSTNVNFGKQYIDEESVNVHRLGNATQIDLNLNEHHYLIGGFDLQSDFVDGRPDTVLYGRHKAWNLGVYIQDEIAAGKKWTVTAGIRYDHYRIRGTFMESNVSPKLAAVYQLSKRIAIRALLARAYRNPSIAERYTKFEQGGGLTFQISPLLRAEKLNLSAEIGGNFNINHHLKADVAIYYNRYKDLISYVQRSAPNEPLRFEVINLNRAIMQGFECSMEYAPIKSLNFQAGYNYLDAKDDSPGRVNDVLAYKSKHTAYFNASYKWKDLQLAGQLRSRSRIDEVFIYPGSEPDGYVLLNAKLTYTFTDSFSAYLKSDNITDVQYEEIERYRMPGRSFGAGLSVSF